MENISLLYKSNNSEISNNISLLREFPYWQPTLAIALFCNIALPSITVLVIYLPLLMVLLRMLKKELLKALNLIHVSLLTASILDDIMRTYLFSIYLPSALRYCICSGLISAMIGAEYRFFFVYRPLAFACLSVLQFLVVIGKKKCVNLKVACAMIALCIGVSSICSASLISQPYFTERRLICDTSFCPRNGPETVLDNHAVILFSLVLIVLLPSLAIVFVTSAYSCAVFKKYYTGGDDQLNRRMLSLPFIMPLVIIATSLLEVFLSGSVAHVKSMLSLGDFFPYWIIFTNSALLSVLRFIIRLPYSLVLLNTHTSLHTAVKGLLDRLKNRNRVIPGLVNSTASGSN